jgi:hypothetical protein
MFSGGAGYYGWGQLVYSQNKYELSIIDLYDNDSEETCYKIDGISVSQLEFNTEFEKQEDKTDVDWINYSYENIIAEIQNDDCMNLLTSSNMPIPNIPLDVACLAGKPCDTFSAEALKERNAG